MPSSYNVGGVEIALTTQLNDAISAVNKLANELNKISGVLGKTKTHIDNVGKSTTNVKNNADKASKALSGMFSLGKLYFFINYSRRIAQSIGGIVQSAIDYNETINKFERSMGNMYDKAIAFQDKLHEAYGLAKADLMDYQANFNNIIKGLGNINVGVAYNLSETLTEMSIDFASLFNTSIDSAMTKFQSALTQQVRPIRSVSGFDITTPTLKSVLQSIGINDRAVSQLNQVEKRLLIIIALQRQMKNINAMKDFADTINEPANQLKILSEQLKETGIAIGNLVLRWIAPALPYVLGFVMAIRTLLETLAALAGYKREKTNEPIIEFEDSANDAAAAVGKTTKAVKDLKNAATGIDELNIISQPKDTDTGGAGGGGLSSIDPRLLAQLETYDSILDDVNLKAKQIRDTILDWLGVTDGTYKNFNRIKTALKIIGGILAVITGLKIYSKIETIVGLITGSKIGKLFSRIGEIITLMKVGNMPFLEAFEAEFGMTLGKFASVLGGVVSVVLGVIELFKGVKEVIEGFANDDTEKKVSGILRSVEGIALVVAGIALLVGAFPVAIVAAIVGAIALVSRIIYKYRENIKEFFVETWEKLKTWFTEKWEKVKEWFLGIPEKLRVFFSETLPFVIGYGLGLVWGKIVGFFASIPERWENFKVTLKTKWDNFVQSLKDKIQSLKNWVSTFIHEKIPEMLNNIIEWFKKLPEKIATIAKNIPKALWNGIVRNWEWFKSKLKSLLSFLGDFSDSLFKGAKAGYEVGYESVQAFATGGFPTRGDYFLANENGVPEYVGSIGNRTAVANTNQIVQGISYGVSMAQSEQNALLRQQNSLLQQILLKGTDVYLNGRKVTNELGRVANARGTQVVLGGFGYGY